MPFIFTSIFSLLLFFSIFVSYAYSATTPLLATASVNILPATINLLGSTTTEATLGGHLQGTTNSEVTTQGYTKAPTSSWYPYVAGSWHIGGQGYYVQSEANTLLDNPNSTNQNVFAGASLNTGSGNSGSVASGGSTSSATGSNQNGFAEGSLGSTTSGSGSGSTGMSGSGAAIGFGGGSLNGASMAMTEGVNPNIAQAEDVSTFSNVTHSGEGGVSTGGLVAIVLSTTLVSVGLAVMVALFVDHQKRRRRAQQMPIRLHLLEEEEPQALTTAELINVVMKAHGLNE